MICKIEAICCERGTRLRQLDAGIRYEHTPGQVTADSVSMVSDAVWTGKPAAVVPIAKSPLGRIAFELNDRLRPGSRIYPQDLRFFWRALADIGISDQLARPRTSTNEVLTAVTARIRSILID